MHLIKRILPFIVQQALLGRTWAGDAVFDSPDDVGNIKIGSEDKGVFIAIYCDEWDMKDPFEGAPGEGAQQVGFGKFKLIIEVGVARKLNAGEGEEGQTTQLAATNEGLEWQLAFISRQVSDTLVAAGPTFPWSQLFQAFIAGNMMQMQIRRGGPEVKPGQQAPRYASAVTLLHVSTISEPVRGQTITPATQPVWARLFELMKATDATAEEGEGWGSLADLLRAHIEPVDGVEAAADKVAAARFFVSAETIHALGLTPYATAHFAPLEPTIEPGEPVRRDVPAGEQDMADWLESQGPDPEQGGPNYGG